MLVDVAQFRWHVFAGGYLCEDHAVDGKDTRSLAPDMSGPDISLKARYPLVEDPALFRTFAATEQTEAGIIAFASEWGPLWDAHDFGEEFLDPDWDEENIDSFTWTWDPIESWFKEIRKMRSLVDLWDALGLEPQKKLSQIIEVRRDRPDGLSGQIAFVNAPELRWNFFCYDGDRPYNIRELARLCLLYHVNDSLWGLCSPWLRPGDSPSGPAFCLIPHNLIAAMWLMFAEEILGKTKLKQCAYCKKHFDVAKEENDRRPRSDKKYCSPKCRAASFRERTEDAQRGAAKKTKPQQPNREKRKRL